MSYEEIQPGKSLLFREVHLEFRERKGLASLGHPQCVLEMYFLTSWGKKKKKKTTQIVQAPTWAAYLLEMTGAAAAGLKQGTGSPPPHLLQSPGSCVANPAPLPVCIP